MNIAILITNLTLSGGTERQVLRLAQELERLGHKATLYAFSLNPETCYPDLISGVRIVALEDRRLGISAWLGRIPAVRGIAQTLVEFRNARALARLIDRHTDIVNPHDQGSTRVAWYFKTLIKPVPSVWMFNDLTLRNWSLFDDPLFGRRRAGFLKRVFNAPLDWWEYLRFFAGQDVILAVSQRAADIVRTKMGRGASVVRIGTDPEQFLFRQRSSKPDRSIHILSQGIFFPHRRFEDLLWAVKLLVDRGSDPRLVIVGSHDHKDTARSYHKRLAAMASWLGIAERVRFAGAVSEQDLRRAYAAADVFVSPAHCQTWGIAVTEAMAAGLPVIVSRTAGVSEIIEDGRTGLLVDPGSPLQIASGIERLISDPALAQRVSGLGSEHARQNMTWTRYAGEMASVFSRVSGKSSGVTINQSQTPLRRGATTDTPIWSKEFYDHKARWIHYFHQIKMARNRIRTFAGERNAFSVLEVGPAHGVVSDYLKKFGVRVTTLDIREEYKPDVVGSVSAMPFPENSFDMILVCEVLEHLPLEQFARALAELRRVTAGAVLLSLPDARLTLWAFTFKLPSIKERQILIKIPNPRRTPRHDGHQFELGRPGYSLGRMRHLFREAGFRISLERCYAETLNNYYFLLEKR